MMHCVVSNTIKMNCEVVKLQQSESTNTVLQDVCNLRRLIKKLV